jgi:hypothetical protein
MPFSFFVAQRVRVHRLSEAETECHAWLSFIRQPVCTAGVARY